MRTEDRLLFLAIRQAFGPEASARAVALAGAPLDWAYLWNVARAHGVAPLVYTNLRRCKGLAIPPEIDGQFKEHLFLNITRRQNTTRAVIQAVDVFNRYGIDVMLVKGEALNLGVYDQPWYTYSEDADLLARPLLSDLPAGLRNTLRDRLQDLNDQRSSLQSNLEYEFGRHHDISMNGVLRLDFSALWQRARAVTLDGRRVFIPSPEDLFLTGCISACRKRFFRLKGLCDLNELLLRHPDLDWAAVSQRAAVYGCVPIVYTALTVLARTLGPVPAEAVNALSIPPGRAGRIQAIAARLLQRYSLEELSPTHGTALAGRALNPALWLTYAQFTPAQAGRKLLEIAAGSLRYLRRLVIKRFSPTPSGG
jgi:hypothetical protein